MNGQFNTKEGDRVQGFFGLNKNRNNPRHIDIVISAEHIAVDGKTFKNNKEVKVFEMQ